MKYNNLHWSLNQLKLLTEIHSTSLTQCYILIYIKTVLWKRNITSKQWIKCEVPTWHTGAFIVCVSLLNACASIMAGWRVARKVLVLAVLACVLCWALALVATNLIYAHPIILAGWGACITLIDILLAGPSWEEGCAVTGVLGLSGSAPATIGTGIWCAGISLLAQVSWGHRQIFREVYVVPFFASPYLQIQKITVKLYSIYCIGYVLCLSYKHDSCMLIYCHKSAVTWPSRWAAALVCLETIKLTGASIKTGWAAADITNGCQAAVVSEAWSAGAAEVNRIPFGHGATRATIHALWSSAWVTKLASASYVSIPAPEKTQTERSIKYLQPLIGE